MTDSQISAGLIGAENDKRAAALKSDHAALGEKLARGYADIDTVTNKVAEFFVAVPSWGVGTGGTRFARAKVASERPAVKGGSGGIV